MPTAFDVQSECVRSRWRRPDEMGVCEVSRGVQAFECKTAYEQAGTVFKVETGSISKWTGQ